MLGGEQPPRAPEARLHLVEAEERPVAAAELLRAVEVAGLRQDDALAEHGLDDEERDVLAARARASSASRSLNGTLAIPGRYGPKRSVNAASPFTESEPSVSPWKACSTQTMRWRPVAARPSLIAASTDSVPLLREQRLADRGRRAPDQLLGQQRRHRRDPHLRRVRRLALHRLDEPLAHARVRPADVEHPVAAEPVEVALAVRVEEVRALGSRPVAVEADRPQHPDHLRVHVLRVQVQGLPRPRVQQLAELAHRGEGY